MPGRVGIDDLEILARDDAHDAVACGLRLGGDDREFFAHEAFISVDLPTLGLPMIFTKPERCIFLLYSQNKGRDLFEFILYLF